MGRSGLPLDGPNARNLTLLDDPAFDWIALAKGYGVPASRAATTTDLEQAIAAALTRHDGPSLIEMVLP